MRDKLTPRVPAVLVCALLWSSAVHGGELIYHQDWIKIANATSVLQLPALQRVVDQFEANENSKIVIQYPGGDAGNEWAVELRDWLVSLGVSVNEIELQPGSGTPEALVVKTETVGWQ